MIIVTVEKDDFEAMFSEALAKLHHKAEEHHRKNKLPGKLEEEPTLTLRQVMWQLHDLSHRIKDAR